jgi:hypothetical protein
LQRSRLIAGWFDGGRRFRRSKALGREAVEGVGVDLSLVRSSRGISRGVEPLLAIVRDKVDDNISDKSQKHSLL